MTFKGLYIL